MIYDFIPVSLVDFPGKISATAFISGCNFKCPYCHNSWLIPVREGIRDEKDFFKYLKSRTGLIDGVAITGGEPTLWKGLKDFIKDIKSLKFSVKLDTNGSRPDALKELIDDGLIDYIAMDIKAPINKYGIFAKNESDIDKIKESVEIIKNSHTDYEFRTTVNDKILCLEDFILISKWLSGSKRYVLQAYKYSNDVLDRKISGAKACNPEFLKQIKEMMANKIEEILIRA